MRRILQIAIFLRPLENSLRHGDWRGDVRKQGARYSRAQIHDTYPAERAALSNNAQIIMMGAWVIRAELAKSIAEAYLAQSFDPNGRSASNVAAIDALGG